MKSLSHKIVTRNNYQIQYYYNTATTTITTILLLADCAPSMCVEHPGDPGLVHKEKEKEKEKEPKRWPDVNIWSCAIKHI